MSGAIIIPAAFLHFTFIYVKKDSQHKKIVFCAYIFSAIYLLLNCTPYFIKDVEPRYWFRYWPVPGVSYHLFQIFFVITVAYSHYLLFKNAIEARNEAERKQFMLVAIGTLVAFSGGSTNFFLWYNIPIPPVLNILVVGYVVLIAHAIHYYKLWDIQVIIRRTLVFTILLAFVFGVYTFATLFIKHVLSSFFFVSDFWSNALAIGLIVVGYDPLRKFLVDLTDKYLFQKGYDYHKVLKDASRGMAKIESLNHLLGLVLHFITMKMRVESAAVLALDTQDRLFRLCASRGYRGGAPKVSLNTDHPLIIKMRLDHDAIQLHEILERLETEKDKDELRELKIISEEMQMLGAKCAIPSFLGKELRNVLVIGDKKSGEPHTSEDINLLMTLAQESSIAIENARLYDEAIKKQKQLGQINDQLENSKKMLVQALAQAEGANKQLQDTQAQLIHEQKMATLGRLAASVGHEVNNPLTILSMNVSRAILKFRKNPDLKVNEILDVFDKMEKNIERIKAVVNTLTGLLKKSEKGKFEPLSLKLILEETLPLVQFQTYMDNLTGTEVELNVPGSVPLIRGDLERLQEIFLNLFINAYHAMAGKRFRKIRVDAELDPQEQGMVAIHFTDNGTGMSEETMKKIFNYGYTTKPPGKGSGMGLYMCKYIVELHGGTIRVKSTLGEGTTFTVTLPVYKEEPTAASVSQIKPKPGTDAAAS